MTVKKHILSILEILPFYYLGYYGRKGVDLVLDQLSLTIPLLIRYTIYLALFAILVIAYLKVNSYIEKRYFKEE